MRSCAAARAGLRGFRSIAEDVVGLPLETPLALGAEGKLGLEV